jgi:hypothetical protein
MAEWALVIFYCYFFCLLIQHISFFKKRALPRQIIQVLFLWKVGVGLFYNFIMQGYYAGGDSFYYFQKGKLIYNILYKNAYDYFYLVFGFHHLPETVTHYWIYEDWMSIYNDTGAMLLVRFHALIFPFTLGCYNVHTVFYNFIVVCGLVCATDFFYKNILKNKLWLAIILFVIPSFDFWTSGMHKDGFTIAGIGFILFSFDKWLEKKQIKYFLMSLIFCWLFFWLRMYALVILIPWLGAMWLHAKIPSLKNSAYLIAYLIPLIFLLFQFFFQPNSALQDYIFNQQAELSKYEVRTNNIVPANESATAKIIFALPKAFLFPMNWKQSNTMERISVIENYLILLLLVCFVIIAIYKKYQAPFFSTGLILFSMTYLFFIGYFIHIEGALARYKSVPVFLLIIALSGIIARKKI